MKKTKISVEGTVELTYDENSAEFKEALSGYIACIDRHGDKESMLKHVAFYVTRFGTDGMVEGVGYVGVNGKKPTEEPDSGIMVGESYDEFDFYVEFEGEAGGI